MLYYILYRRNEFIYENFFVFRNSFIQIGISAGYSLNKKDTFSIVSAFVGAAMIISSFLTMQLISLLNTGISKSNMLGILCGALTTTPGLSSVCEKNEIVIEDALLGYGNAYLFGVVCTVVTVQIIIRNKQIKTQTYNYSSKSENNCSVNELIQLGLSVFCGKILGNLTIPIVQFSLGDSGGMLCAGIIIGFFSNKVFKINSSSKNSQITIKNIGLVLFFVGNGIPAGVQIKNGLSCISTLIGIILTIVPILTGIFICKVLLQKNNIDTATIISGGMTSSPALGVISSNKNISYDTYSFTYVGALITVMLLMRM